MGVRPAGYPAAGARHHTDRLSWIAWRRISPTAVEPAADRQADIALEFGLGRTGV